LLANYAWYGESFGDTTHPVGQKLPNPWGLYDMHGNVWEWCQDWAVWNYAGGTVTDPQGPDTGWCRIMRGGSLSWFGNNCRSASRGGAWPTVKNDTGFRVVLAPVQP
jgi:formylglycine-generating enzyme required for sulfatase activity